MASPGLPRPLSAKYTRDFAYPTLKDRLPVILTKVVDTVHRMKGDIGDKYGQEGLDQLKEIVGRLSKLRSELQTDKPLADLCDGLEDVEAWNKFLEEDRAIQENKPPSWFQSAWLYTECYFYRRIKEAIQLSTSLKHLDPFGIQKRNALMTSQPAIMMLSEYLQATNDRLQTDNHGALRETFTQFLQMSLWGNKCDLSISSGAENSQKTNPVQQLDKLETFILHNDTDPVWEILTRANKANPDNVHLDIVLDNAGFELFTDLCFAEFLLSNKLVKSVNFHIKNIPWFVSDVTEEDFSWTLNELGTFDNKIVQTLASRWQQRLEDGSWVIHKHPYWTQPHDFAQMKQAAPELYKKLSKADLIFFKGDLNYRKLVGDLTWKATDSFVKALRGFKPAPLCTLRTLKCDLVCGLAEGQAERAAGVEENWMLTGNFAVIQHSPHKT